jgi:uncharacterized protein YndB with AHSA1/START domain
MSVQADAGRRFTQIEIEVPGTPEEVWQAIATGPGISSWFVPTQIEQQGGKPVAVTASFGPGMEVSSRVTTWDPPRRFTSESDGFPGTDSPPLAVEWNVEARAGGVCTVRIVHSLFASTDDWDDQLEAGAAAWPAFLRTLRIYLTHFRGQRSALMQLVVPVACTEDETWDTLTSALGVKGLSAGQHWTTPAGVPSLSGAVEYLTQDPYDALMRLDQPAGICALGAFTAPGGPSMAAMNFYLYGDQAAETVARETPRWEHWLRGRFPMPAEAAAQQA